VLRVLLFSLFGILALFGVVFIGLISWAWLATLDSENAEEEGRTAGVGATDQGCLEQAVSQIEKRKPLFVAFYEATFLSECLAVSRATEAFCAGVPDISDQAGRAVFNESRCSSVNASRFACYSLFTQVNAHCAQRADRPPPP
jgi:hypothetical protein